MRDMVRVDGVPDTVAALMRCGVTSRRNIACPLRMSCRSTSYYRRPTTSMSYTHLMSVIRCVWSVTHAFNALPARVPGEAMVDLMSDVLGTHRYTPGAKNYWARGGSRALPHHGTCGGTGALPSGGSGASVT
jgi:hypothetical protein